MGFQKAMDTRWREDSEEEEFVEIRARKRRAVAAIVEDTDDESEEDGSKDEGSSEEEDMETEGDNCLSICFVSP